MFQCNLTMRLRLITVTIYYTLGMDGGGLRTYFNYFNSLCHGMNLARNMLHIIAAMIFIDSAPSRQFLSKEIAHAT